MKLYLFSLLAGVLVGVIYSLLHVRSPAPPLVAFDLASCAQLCAAPTIAPVLTIKSRTR